jgi:hypothetical protein
MVHMHVSSTVQFHHSSILHIPICYTFPFLLRFHIFFFNGTHFHCIFFNGTHFHCIFFNGTHFHSYLLQRYTFPFVSSTVHFRVSRRFASRFTLLCASLREFYVATVPKLLVKNKFLCS